MMGLGRFPNLKTIGSLKGLKDSSAKACQRLDAQSGPATW